MKTSTVSGISFLFLPSIRNFFPDKRGIVDYRLSLDTATRMFDGNTCWAHPRAGIMPAIRNNGTPRIVMTMNSLDLSGSDIFKGMYGMESSDLGKTWTEPKELIPMMPRYEKIGDIDRPVALSDFWPGWHKASKTLLGTGHTVAYTPDWRVTNPRPRNTAYSTYNVEAGEWSRWSKLDMPEGDKFYNSGAGCTQRYDEQGGIILLPVYIRPKEGNLYVTVCKCSFDGKELAYIENGSELKLDIPRGLGEPSLTFFQGSYFLTLRNDQRAYVARSRDGLHFEGYEPWRFDDGSELGSYNTQQHWVTHSDALFLVYTRRGANNDHVFRHRAPLFMAQVDPEKLCVIRETEQILVPERGARLGNFGVTDVSPDETWVTVSEWMQPKGVEKYGSDGSVFVARIHWNKPNR
ncbi:MAG: exo-alpha-sialidase, partial [Chitinophagaceae bacterium]|nr:exo-alpha-sialidase [Chitinophagaceae bacterium]